MALDKQTIPISFSQGIDTKSDPKQLSGKLTDLQNGIFQTGMEIRKRNGYTALPSLSAGVGLAAYQSELVSLDGSNLYSYNANGSSQISKGALPTLNLSTQTVVRNNTQQTIQDSAINGTLRCFVWYDSAGQVGYSVFDTSTGQSIVNNQTVSATGTRAKVLALGSYFIIIYYDSTGPALKYKAINTATPTTLGSAVTIASDIGSTYTFFDATVISSKIYVAYQNTDTTHVSLYSLTSGLVLSSQYNVSATAFNALSIFGDGSGNAWVAFSFNTATKVFVVNGTLNSTVLAVTTLEAVVSRNITGVVSGTTASIYYEVVVAGTATVPTNVMVKSNTMTLVGVAGTAVSVLRGAGLAAKVFTQSSANYLLVAYQSSLQSTYFMITASGSVVGKLSPSEGGGWTSVQMLPEMNTVSSGVFQTASLIKDLLTVASGTVSTQTGVISATFTFQSSAPSKFVLGQNLHVAGAQLSMYDGSNIVEHGFHVYPDDLTATLGSSAGTSTGTLLSTAIGVGTVTASGPAAFQYSAVYEWTDNQGQIHRSAPSIPVTASGVVPGYAAQTQVNGAVVSSATVVVDSTNGIAIGQYVLVRDYCGSAAQLLPNATVTNISGLTLTLSTAAGATGIGDNAVIYFSNYPFAWFNGSPSAIGSKTLTLTSGNYSNLAVGQVIQPAMNANGLGTVGTNGFYPAGTYITAISGNAGSTITVTLSQPAKYAWTGGFIGTATIFYSMDVVNASVVIPTLRLTAKSNVSIALYRTEINGTVFYRATSPTSLTYNTKTADSVTITDTTNDTILVGNEQLYTTGEVENIGVPAVKVSNTFKSRAIVVPSENQLSWWYSKQVIPGSPVEFSDSFVNNIDSRIGQITAIGVIDDKLIFFGPSSIFYVVGDGPAASGANNTFSDAQLISSDTGCSNQASVLLTPDGLMFQSPKGIYLLDRSLGVKYIGSEVEAYNSYTVTSAQLMQSVNQVRFTISNGQALVYDYFYRQWSVFTNHSAVDSCIFQNNFTFLSSSGTILTEAPGVYTDNGSPVLLSVTSNWLSFANVQGFQRIWQFLLLGTYKSPHTMTVNLFTDYSETAGQTVSVPWTAAPTTPYQYRIFVSNQKCETMQVQLVETQTAGSYGEGLSISAVAFLAGLKKGSVRVPATQSFG